VIAGLPGRARDVVAERAPSTADVAAVLWPLVVLFAVMAMLDGVAGAAFAGAAVPTIWKPGNFSRCTLSP